MDFKKHLSPRDSYSLLEIIDACVHCRYDKQLCAIIEKFRRLISFRCITLSFLQYNELQKEQIAAEDNFNLGFPEEFMHRYFREELYWVEVPVMAFFNTFELQNWKEAIEQYHSGIPTGIDLELAEYGICDGWVCGTRNKNNTKLTTISLGSDIIENNHRTRAIIKLASPHILEAYQRILQLKELQKYHLTQREIEVLNWIKDGKTSWEISVILKISERCVNSHINNAKATLNSVTRTQAVAVTLGTELISL